MLDKEHDEREGITARELLREIDFVEGFRYELHEGVLRVSPSPGLGHQRLESRFERYFEARGREAFHEVTIQIDQYNVRIPDVVRLRPGMTPPEHGPVSPHYFDLFVEIVSRSTRDEDRIVKPKAYARAGIAEYWRVELEEKGYVVYMHQLEDGRYVETRVVPVEELFAE